MFESGIETMWKTLHQLAIPPRLYQICGWFIPWLAIASVVVLTVGWIWGFGFAPADYQQGNSYRIIYLHVPAAIWSMGIYASMAVAAFIGLVWQMKMANLAVAAMAPIGAVFTFIALVTGSAWGKPMWGTWWVWDARLTSELVLLFLYVGVIALWHAFDDRRLAGRAAGILVLIGVVNLPIIHYSVNIRTFPKPRANQVIISPSTTREVYYHRHASDRPTYRFCKLYRQTFADYLG